MSDEQPRITQQGKQRLIYGAMVLAGGVFVSTLFLPIDQSSAQFIAALSFGLMSGLWLSHLVHST